MKNNIENVSETRQQQQLPPACLPFSPAFFRAAFLFFSPVLAMSFDCFWPGPVSGAVTPFPLVIDLTGGKVPGVEWSAV